MPLSYLKRLLGQNEKMVLITRQHWFLLLGAILVEAVLSAALVAATLVFLPISPLAWLGLAVAAVIVVRGVYDFLGWWNRQYVVTSRRVIQVSGVVNKNVIDSSLEKVNDVKMAQSFFGRIFDYGDVEILTASELGVNLFQRIADPIRFKTAMLNAKERMGRDEDVPGATGVRKEDIPAMIAKLDALRRQGAITEEEFQREKEELLTKM
jgi:uncharacterized membrane protein YdbT with pleckstrin-like domain